MTLNESERERERRRRRSGKKRKRKYDILSLLEFCVYGVSQ